MVRYAPPVVQPGPPTPSDKTIASSVSCQANDNKTDNLPGEQLSSNLPELDSPDGWWAHWMS
jgi:hypothetical protein